MELAQGLLPLASALICQARDRATRTERENAAAQLKAQHPELVSPQETKGGSLVAAAKNLRTQLKQTFPGVKFSVTTDRFAGGDSLRVAWTDGPAVDRVSAIACQYKAGHFNGYEDLYEYEASAWTDAFGDAKYVSTSRDYSPMIAAWLAADDVDYPARWEAQRERHSMAYHLNIKAIKQPEAE